MKVISSILVSCLFFLSTNLYAAECSNISDEREFRDAIEDPDNRCSNVWLSDNIPITYEFDVSGSNDEIIEMISNEGSTNPKYIVVWTEGKTLDLNYFYFKNVSPLLIKSYRATIKNAIFESRLPSNLRLSDQLDVGNTALYVSYFTPLFCHGCVFKKGDLKVEGGGSLLWSMVEGSNSKIIIDTNSRFIISATFFIDPGSSPYITVKKVKNGLYISHSLFEITDNPAISLQRLSDSDSSLDQMFKFSASKFIKVGEGSLDMDSLITSVSGASYAVMEKPDIKYDTEDENYYNIIINNNYSENGDRSYWGRSSVTCPDSLQNEHIRFEPYYLKYEDEELKGLFPIMKFDYELGERYLKIEKGQDINISTKDVSGTVELGDDKIAIVAQCEGRGTTRFSNIITLGVKVCETDVDCGESEECREGVCKPLAPPECVENTDCDENETCEDGTCTEKNSNFCTEDSDCESDHYCDVGRSECLSCSTLPAVDAYCTDGSKAERGTEGAYRCPSGEDLECRLNAGINKRCGNLCVCQEGYRPMLEGMCADSFSGAYCPPGTVPDKNKITCVSFTRVPSKKSGGCSLILE